MLIYEENVPASYRTAFVAKVREISTRLGINPNWLMAIINWESARSFSSSIRNPYTNATGLIQFMPDTAIDLGTTIDRLARMTAVEQLDWVYKYYVRYRSKLKSYTDLYLTTFYPAAVGKAASYVLGSTAYRVRRIAEQNSSFDNNGDMKITKGEIESDMLEKIPANWMAEFKKKVVS
ncbi:transglycosylase SLT domain-containing protein [Zunongwangia sp. F363]|uniref:Transglycosylase SLT domain-containing protein n=1 Tax=Autumnicola tepida TaxID=3075595 RepID=A0ABU3CBI2_9FLAO|nr:transglycosylase SLT domain-containing protein [Zunongwangia sp. F363]MDT0643689.1 transglycosylase SLT domain-containing protein [Zunongwangia sp. F363]